MSLRALRGLDLQSGTNTTTSLTQLPSTLLEALIPGYSVLSRLVSDILGFDISIFVSILVLLFAISTGGQFVGKQLSAQFLRWFSCSITVDAYDPIYDHILAWAAESESLQKVRSLRGHSAGESNDEDITDIKVDADFGEDSIFNFNNWAAKAAPRYEPNSTSGLFRHKAPSGGYGNWFFLTRDRERIPGGWMGMGVQDQEKLTLTVLGRSTKPLKELIVEMRDIHLAKAISMTVIRRPSPKEQRGRGRHAWHKVASRPSRPMTTVVLDDLQKATILRDINDFLHPRTPRWYANRGIPYRRGYLFHGPPGTGKTSLSFALAGVFGLDIYCLSLSEATLTEEDLILLFNSLPKRCVVLLEDIDSAGVLRKGENKDDDQAVVKSKKDGKMGGRKDGNKGNKGKGDAVTASSTADMTAATAATVIAAEIAKAIKSVISSSDDSPHRGGRGGGTGNANQGITMSGLLNAIDGVASQEGRVLVMTTNYPEKLDDALIRPGRVDMKIEFGLARREQVRELFTRMYCVDENERPGSGAPTKISDVLPQGVKVDEDDMKSDGSGKGEFLTTNVLSSATNKKSNSTFLPTPPMTPKPIEQERKQDPSSFATDLPRLANLFADAIPDAVFSPAEIQGFLLTRKKSPVQAVLDVGKWRDEEMSRKERKSNVVISGDKRGEEGEEDEDVSGEGKDEGGREIGKD